MPRYVYYLNTDSAAKAMEVQESIARAFPGYTTTLSDTPEHVLRVEIDGLTFAETDDKASRVRTVIERLVPVSHMDYIRTTRGMVYSEGLRLWIEPGDAPPEVVADVLRALSDLHIAAGGTGLRYTLDEDESLIISSVEEHV